MVREFPKYLSADHVVTMHVDGYILHPEKWMDEFLSYDYVGAPWGYHEWGGNGGFSLRSRKFCEWAAGHHKPISNGRVEDGYLCIDIFEDARSAGFSYSPKSVGSRFSYENELTSFPRTMNDVFGFHGKHNLDKL